MARTREDRDQLPGWHFWRKPFWTRPALLLLYSAAIAAGGAVWLITTAGVFVDARVVGGERLCSRTGSPCATEVVGRIEGPRTVLHHRSRSTLVWTFAAEGFRDEFEVTPGSDDDVRSMQSVATTALVRHDNVLAVRTRSGLLAAHGADLDTEIWWLLGLVGLPGLTAYGVRWSILKARACGSWWATPLSPPRFTHPWLTVWAMAPVFAACLISLLGAAAWVGVVAMLVIALVITLMARRSPPAP